MDRSGLGPPCVERLDRAGLEEQAELGVRSCPEGAIAIDVKVSSH
jgi:hypothetical protein